MAPRGIPWPVIGALNQIFPRFIRKGPFSFPVDVVTSVVIDKGGTAGRYARWAMPKVNQLSTKMGEETKRIRALLNRFTS